MYLTFSGWNPIFNDTNQILVFHAAAHKHVSLMEQQPAEAFRNNTLGTIAIADMAVRNGVEQVPDWSPQTKQLIRPASWGRPSVWLRYSYNPFMRRMTHQTRFMAVRFGNVLGSSGSVVPIFEKQIDEGGPVTVTHPEVTRFFMTIPEAVGLILQSAITGKRRRDFRPRYGSILSRSLTWLIN